MDINYVLLLKRAKILVWLYLVLILILKLLGLFTIDINVYNSIQAFSFIDNSIFLRIAIHSIMAIVTYNLMFATFIKCYKDKWKQLNIIIVIYSITLNSIIDLGYSGNYIMLVSMIMYFVPLLYKENLSVCAKIFIGDTIFQLISVITRGLGFPDYRQSVIIPIIFMLDYYIMWIIYYLNKGGGNKWLYGELAHSYSVKKNQNLNMKKQSMKKCLKNVQQNLIRNISKRKLLTLMKNCRCWIKYSLYLKLRKKILPFVVFLGLYFGFAHFSHKYIESVLLLISYGSFRFLYPKQFHADYIPNIKKNWINFTCISLSSLVLCTALYNVVIIEYSILSSILVGFVVDWLLYVVRDWFDLSKRYNTDFTKYGLTKYKSQIAYEYKVEGLSLKEQADKYKLSEKVISNYRNEINNAIKSYKSEI